MELLFNVSIYINDDFKHIFSDQHNVICYTRKITYIRQRLVNPGVSIEDMVSPTQIQEKKPRVEPIE
jgi:hypothetical protein